MSRIINFLSEGDSMKKVNKTLLIKHKVNHNGDNIFTQNARLLQSLWREQLTDISCGYGNYFCNSVPKSSNFLTYGIYKVVQDTLKNKESGAVIDKSRLFYNLLSSQPLAFNLFGELKNNLDLATKVFYELGLLQKNNKVDDIIFEHSPGRNNKDFIEDKTAFDVFIKYSDLDDHNGFIGIEVKYAEDMKDKPSSHKDKYDEVAQRSGIFDKNNYDKLKQKPIQQIWREHLLCLSIIQNQHIDGKYLFIYPQDNIQCENAIKQYKECLKSDVENTYFIAITLEKIIETIRQVSDKKSTNSWFEIFYQRYLDFSKIDELN